MSTTPAKELSRRAVVFVLAVGSILAGVALRLSARSLSTDIRGPYNERTYSAPVITPFDPLRYQLLTDVATIVALFGIALLLLATHHWLLDERASAGERR